MAEEKKRMNLDMPEEIAAWVSYMAGVKDVSKIAYVNDCIRQAMEDAPQPVKDAFRAFLAARESL